ncbi:MAG: M20/M25/M40 family metallo-hydrolase [Deltaproteobacteria bacterium]|nr:MAG: M20/M25/M40 family metallo-hydrolase [Deltaproteobacteria bacterium]
MRLVFAAAFMLCGACATRQAPLPPIPAEVRAWQDAVDWDEAGDEAVDLLAEYLKIDTSNPPGGEFEGAMYLAAQLDRDDIPWKTYEIAPGRTSIVGRLAAKDPTAPPLCLVSHIDVVPADAAEWPEESGPFSGVIDEEGMLWGRGALDMKGLGTAELQVMALLKRLDAPLRRDVLLVAVADEEVNNLGMIQLVEDHWDDLNCAYVINEGAYGVVDALFEGQTVHAISVGEKGALWLEVIARGEPGHGSTPLPDTAIDRLRQAMARIDERTAKPDWHPMMMELLANVGNHRGGFSGGVLRRPAMVKSLARGKILANPLTRASLTTTFNLTGLQGAEGFNVVPHRAVARYDIRLQPEVTAEEVVAEIEELVAGIPTIEVKVARTFGGAVSEWRGDPVYEAIASHAIDGRPDAVAGPFLSIGFTDSIFARHKGARAYGYAPFVIDRELLETMHGHRERIPVDQVREGARRLFGIVVQTAVDVAQAPPSAPAKGRAVAPVLMPHEEPAAAPSDEGPPQDASDDPASPSQD